MHQYTKTLSNKKYNGYLPSKGLKINGCHIKHLLVPHESDVLQVRLEGPHSLFLEVVVLAEDNLHLDIDSLQLRRVNTEGEQDNTVTSGKLIDIGTYLIYTTNINPLTSQLL